MAGRKEGLTWLLECLEETLEDRQDEEDVEAIPLVPLSDMALAAMEDHTFLRFIAKMGLTPPADEQVLFALLISDIHRVTKFIFILNITKNLIIK